MQRELTRMMVRTAPMLLTCLVFGAGCAGNVEAPTKFSKYTAKDGAFSCLRPAGWEREQGARPDNLYSWVKFTKGNAQIKITADATGSMMADAAKASPFGTPEDKELSAVAGAHDRQKRSIAEDYSNYKERPPRSITGKLGDGRQSDFGADGSFGMRLRGTRSTFLTNNRRVSIMCQCPLPNWKTLKPAFDKVVDSVAYGGGR